MKPYIYQKPDWPKFRWDNDALQNLLSNIRTLQAKLIGKMEALGFELQDEAILETITTDVLKSIEIEGELLNPEQVRSSIARKLGMDIAGSIPSDRNVDGVVEMTLDATQNYKSPLSKDRLFGWHSALFPSDGSGIYKILVGQWRDDRTGPMQVVSGVLGKEKIHFQAPDASIIEEEMNRFLDWFNSPIKLDPLLKSAIAHFGFVTIHPFDDGNGRIARAITGMLLARADSSSQRFYSMSAQIRLEREGYYEILEKSSQGTLDITKWLHWFLTCLLNTLKASDVVLARVMFKHQFWNIHAKTVLNHRQVLILNKLLDDFDGKLSSSKWAKIAKCSHDTALRDMQDLITKNVLRKEGAGGRSTNYELVENKKKLTFF